MINILDLLVGGAGGGVIGTTGAFANRWLEAKTQLQQKKVEMAHEIALSLEERKTLALRLDSEKEIKTMQLSSDMDKTAGADFVASTENDRATYSTIGTKDVSPWLIAVDVLRGLMRPGLTIGLSCVNGYLAITLIGQLQDQKDVALMFANSIAALTGMAISWWFGSRPHGNK